MKSNVISWITSSLWYLDSKLLCQMCATVPETAKIWLLFCYLFNSDETALFPWAAQEVEDMLKTSCLLLILFCLQVHFHTTAGLRAFSPVLHVVFGSSAPAQGQCKAKLLFLISCTALAVKIIELPRMCFNQDWEYMPLASVGAGTCLKSRAHLIYQISSMHEAKWLQKQQHEVLCVSWAVRDQTCPHCQLLCEVVQILGDAVRKCPLAECGTRLLGQEPWAANCWD